MPQDILKTIHERLNEEKWTRATLSSYSINNFKELDQLLDQTRHEKQQDEAKEICDEHLNHTKNSIIALYISGVISLGKQLVDDSNLATLIDIFSDNHKWNIVEYLCNRILDFGENKYALRTLVDCYEHKNEDERKYEVWDRLIKIDYEEAGIVKDLAEKKEEDGDVDGAVEYYKKALHRFISKKMFANVKELWDKLVDYIPEDVDFFLHVEKKIAQSLSGDRASSLLQTLLPYYESSEEWDIAIDILKRILSYEPKNNTARKRLVECYRQKYQNHSQIDEYIKMSNLSQSWRNVLDAIADFEKHISFDEGNYVYHRSWGIGKIVGIKNDEFYINFAGKSNHKMSLKMAVNALKILSRDHILVLKSTWDKAKLKERVKKDPAWALQIVIRSFSNAASMKRVKKVLVPDVLSQSEWTKWNVEARKTLKTNPVFGNLPDKIDRFTVRDRPISYEEKTFNKFRAERSFFGRVKAIHEFLDSADPDSEFFGEMFSYFTTFLKSYSSANEQVVSSYLLVQRIVSMYPFLNPDLGFTFRDLFEKIENIEEVYSRMEDSDLRRELLLFMKRFIEDWPETFVRLFYLSPNRFIIDELVQAERWVEIESLVNHTFGHYRDYGEPFVWIARNLGQESWFEEFGIMPERTFIGMIHLLDISFREISNRRDVGQNRKLNKQIQTYLFKEEKLIDFLMQAGEESITRLYTLVEDCKDLDPSIKIGMKQRIRAKYPQFTFYGEPKKEVVSMGILTTREGYDRRQRELKHTIESEIPENSEEIGHAIEKGDLRENAEYKAAIEKQEMLKSRASRLQEELQRAQIFDVTQVDTARISFGTTVRLKNLADSRNEQYTILGPWESDPSKNVISYLSPLGAELCDHLVGEKLRFKINEKEFHYSVDGIEKAVLNTS